MKNIFSPAVFLLLTVAALSCHRGKPAENETPNTAPAATAYPSLSNEEFARVIAGDSIQLVDVRTPEEYGAGHIEGAVNIDVKSSGFAQKADSLDKKYPVAVYCKGGVRSRKAADILTEKGYTVYNLDKGYDHWNTAE